MIDATNRNTALATALVDELARCGVRHAFASPGSRSSPLTLALDGEARIALEMVLDERSAGFAALGVALATGRPAAVACTSGSAAANLLPAVVEADQAGVAMIVLTSDRPPELRAVGAGQTIDQIKLYGDAVRWFCEVGTHEADDGGLLHMRALGCRAWAEAGSGRGPVHLNLSWRDPLGPDADPAAVTATDPLAREGRGGECPLTAALAAREPQEALTETVAAALSAARRPLILAGRQTDPGLAAAIAGLAADAGLPLLAEPTSQLRFGPRARARLCCAYDLIARAAPERLRPDLVLRFGDMPTSKALRAWLGAAGPKEIVIDPPGRWHDPGRRADALVRCDATVLAGSLRARGEPAAATEEGWGAAWQEAETAAQRAIDETLASVGEPTEPGLVRALDRRLGDGDSLLLASSMPVRDAEAFSRGSDAAAIVLSNRGANGIDGTISTAAGVARGTEGATWVVLGDLALAHDLGGLAALPRDDRPLRLLVLDNGGGGIFEFLPQADRVERERFERLFITPSALDLERVAALFDLAYVEVESASDLGSGPERGAVLLHARSDRRGNRMLHEQLAAAVAEKIQR